MTVTSYQLKKNLNYVLTIGFSEYMGKPKKSLDRNIKREACQKK